MTRLILIRHGETFWNKDGRFQGQIDTLLSEKGREQAERVTEVLEKVHLDAIYSSPLSRSYETAAMIAEPHGLSVTKEEGLVEISHGVWEGKHLEEVEREYGEILRLWFTHPHQVTMPGGESLEDVQQRAIPVIERIVTSHPNQTVVVVSHDVVNKVIICHLLGLDLSHFWRIRQGNTAINIFDFVDGQPQISLLNDTCHLSGVFEEIKG